MTAAMVARYTFGERVFDATHDEHNECLGLSQVRVIVADYHLETITVYIFAGIELAIQWRDSECADDELADIEYYIVGGDIK